MHNVPVYLSADMSVSDSALTLQADLIAQDVAAELRALVDSSHSAMPNVDGKLTWYSVPAQIVVTARQDGSATWKAKGAGGDSTAAMLLGAAFESAQAHGTARLFWPEGTKADSLIVRLSLVPTYTGFHENNSDNMPRAVKFGVFYLTEPDATPARPKRLGAPPKYPFTNENDRVGGDVIVQLVVDSTGRTDPATIHDLWPADKPRLQGYLADYYNSFVTSVINWEKQMHYEPMRVGGCPVKQVVQQPIKFLAPGAR